MLAKQCLLVGRLAESAALMATMATIAGKRAASTRWVGIDGGIESEKAALIRVVFVSHSHRALSMEMPKL